MDEKHDVLARLVTEIAAVAKDEPLAARLCLACVRVLGADGGAITLASSDQERLTVSTSNTTAARLEDLQDVLGEGPGQQAFSEGHIVVARVDGSRSASYPVFDELAGRIDGPVTLWAVPVRPGGTVVGVLTVYRRDGELAVDLTDVQFLANTIGLALLDGTGVDGMVIDSAWSVRAQVHQATGMVVAQLGLLPVDALAVLRAHAFADDVGLDDVARAVVERRLTFTHSDEGSTRQDHGPDADPSAQAVTDD